MSTALLKNVLIVSEKAANIARVFRQNKHLFELLVQEKKSDEKNPRFVNDYKTLADVLIQEMVKHYIGNEFPTIAHYIKGEESNMFSNVLGDTITVKIESSQNLTAALLKEVLGGDLVAAELLAIEVHRVVELESMDIGEMELPPDSVIPIEEFGIWIDPIDSTAEFISGVEKQAVGFVHTSGLSCVTVLIGVFDRMTGLPVMGVINKPFHKQDDSIWKGQCQWGIRYKDINANSIPLLNVVDTHGESKVVVVSSSESPILKARLKAAHYEVVEVAGAGYKLLCVAMGFADAYILSKGTTFRWDTCAPHAILRSLGGNVIKYNEALQHPDMAFEEMSVSYRDQLDNFCNKDGIIAYCKLNLAKSIIHILCDR